MDKFNYEVTVAESSCSMYAEVRTFSDINNALAFINDEIKGEMNCNIEKEIMITISKEYSND